MPSTQSLILSTITTKLQARDLTVANDTVYANTGVIRAYGPDLSLVGQLDYQFTERDAQFTKGSTVNSYATVTYGRARTSGQIPAVKNNIPELIDAVVGFLSGDIA